MKVTLFVPTLNEIVGMKAVMPKIKKEWCDQILVSDGGSTDGTVEYAREQGYFVHCQKRLGLRHAYSEALPYIEGDVMITFSPDGNCIPDDIPRLIEKMREGYDMVIASRYLNMAASEDDTLVTGFGNWLFTGTVNFLYGAKYTDAMVIYRAYKTRLFSELDLDKDEGYAMPERLFFTVLGIEPLLSVRAVKRGLKIGEIPSDEPPRIGGDAKLQVLRWGAGYYFQFWRELLFWK